MSYRNQEEIERAQRWNLADPSISARSTLCYSAENRVPSYKCVNEMYLDKEKVSIYLSCPFRAIIQVPSVYNYQPGRYQHPVIYEIESFSKFYYHMQSPLMHELNLNILRHFQPLPDFLDNFTDFPALTFDDRSDLRDFQTHNSMQRLVYLMMKLRSDLTFCIELTLPKGFNALPLLYDGRLVPNELTNQNSSYKHMKIDKMLLSILFVACEFDAAHLLLNSHDVTVEQTVEERERDLFLNSFLNYILKRQTNLLADRINPLGPISTNIVNVVGYYHLDWQKICTYFRHKVQTVLFRKAQWIEEQKRNVDNYNRNQIMRSQYDSNQSAPIELAPKFEIKKPSLSSVIRSINVFKDAANRFFSKEYSLPTEIRNEQLNREHVADFQRVCNNGEKHYLVAYFDLYHINLLNRENLHPPARLPSFKINNLDQSTIDNPPRERTHKPIRLSYDLIRPRSFDLDTDSLIIYNLDNLKSVRTGLITSNRKSLQDRINEFEKDCVNFRKYLASLRDINLCKEFLFLRSNDLVEMLSDQMQFNRLFLHLPKSIIDQIEIYLTLKDLEYDANIPINRHNLQFTDGSINNPNEVIVRYKFLQHLLIQCIRGFNLSVACLHALPVWVPMFERLEFSSQRDLCRYLIEYLSDSFPVFVTYAKLHLLESTRLNCLDYKLDIQSQLSPTERQDADAFVNGCLKKIDSNYDSFVKEYLKELSNHKVNLYPQSTSYLMPYAPTNQFVSYTFIPEKPNDKRSDEWKQEYEEWAQQSSIIQEMEELKAFELDSKLRTSALLKILKEEDFKRIAMKIKNDEPESNKNRRSETKTKLITLVKKHENSNLGTSLGDRNSACGGATSRASN